MASFRRQHHDPTGDNVPVVLPHVRIVVNEAGTLAVSIDDQPITPDGDAVWTRDDVAHVLDTVTRDRTIPVRIEVRESDGSVFTDIIHARRRRPTVVAQDIDEVPPDDEPAGGTRLVEVTGAGFVAGEDVAVAVIVAHTDATGTGAARALVDLDQLAPLLRSDPGEVILFGRISGTVHVEGVS